MYLILTPPPQHEWWEFCSYPVGVCASHFCAFCEHLARIIRAFFAQFLHFRTRMQRSPQPPQGWFLLLAL